MAEIRPFKEKFEVIEVYVTEIKFKVKAKFFGVEREFEFVITPKDIALANEGEIRFIIEHLKGR